MLHDKQYYIDSTYNLTDRSLLYLAQLERHRLSLVLFPAKAFGYCTSDNPLRDA